MNKTDLINAIATKADLTKKDSEKTLRAFEEVVTEELAKDGRIQLVGFGTFDVAQRKEREGRNPQGGGKIKIPASKAVRFKVAKSFRDAVNK